MSHKRGGNNGRMLFPAFLRMQSAEIRFDTVMAGVFVVIIMLTTGEVGAVTFNLRVYIFISWVYTQGLSMYTQGSRVRMQGSRVCMQGSWVCMQGSRVRMQGSWVCIQGSWVRMQETRVYTQEIKMFTCALKIGTPES